MLSLQEDLRSASKELVKAREQMELKQIQAERLQELRDKELKE